MGTNRDDFKSSTINLLRTRVASRCSNPECRVPTTGPKTDAAKVNNIGTAAHITAASPGGPRYDKNLSFEERRSINNAIWLCTNCSKKIDNDPDEYTVVLLKEWKKIAEDNAARELGKQLPDENYVVQSLAAAFSGQSDIFLPKLISNACEATSRALESLDPRFSVEASFTNGVSHFNIFAKQNVETQLSVDPSFKNEFYEKYTNFIDHGEKIEISSQALKIKGSPLLEKLQTNIKGKFKFSQSITKDVTIYVSLTSPDGSSKYSFDDFSGTASLGRKSITIHSNSLRGNIAMNMRLSYHDLALIGGDFTININFSKWNNKKLYELPYLNKLHQFYSYINQGWRFNLSLEVEGLHLFSGHCSDIKEQELFKQEYSHLNFIYMVREISKILGVSICYDDSYEYTSDYNMHVKDVYEILSSVVTLPGSKIKENAKCTLEAFEDLSNINELTSAEGKLMQIRIEQQEAEVISPFNQKIVLPRFSHTLTEVYPVINFDISKVCPGDLVEIEWKPSDKCIYKIETI